MKLAFALVTFVVVTASDADVRSAPKVTVETTHSTATGESSLTITKVLAKIKVSYSTSIRRCYEKQFTAAPLPSGDVKLGFVVDKRGKATFVAVSAFNKKLGACVTEQVKTWRFGIPRDKAKSPIEANFAIEYSLTPNSKGDPARPGESTASADMLVGTAEDPIQGDMTKRKPGADLGQQISDVKTGSNVTVGGGRRGSRAPSGRISIASKQSFDETTLTVDAVLMKMMSSYMTGLKSCYTERLVVDPTMRGKIRLDILVNEEGRVVRPTARGPEAELDKCVTEHMRGWVFPVPKDTDGEVTEASFAINLQLVPD